MNKIKELLNNKLPNELSKELNKNIFTDNNIEKIEANIIDQKLLGKKRKKKNKDASKKEKNSDGGNKKNIDISRRKHDKFCGDNIIKKIKFKLFEIFLKFVNDVINKTLDKTQLTKYYKTLRPLNKNGKNCENLIKIIEYKYIDRLNKKLDLEMLNMPFKELFSIEISSIYSTLESNSNRVIIHNY